MKPADCRGNMSEWAVALGLGLKRTAGRFAPRDGRPRGSVPSPQLDEGSEGAVDDAPKAAAAIPEATHA